MAAPCNRWAVCRAVCRGLLSGMPGDGPDSTASAEAVGLSWRTVCCLVCAGEGWQGMWTDQACCCVGVKLQELRVPPALLGPAGWCRHGPVQAACSQLP